jgi:hypothetical protein
MNLFFFLFFFYLFLISVIGYGLFFKSIFYKDDTLDYKYTSIYIGFFGLTIITFISYLSNIFFAHNFAHNVLLHFAGVSFSFFFFKKKYIKYYKTIFFISIFVIISLFISKSNDDFPYYHLTFTKYLVENKLIFGIGNIDHGYNLISSIFFFNSTLYFPIIKFYSFHYTCLYFLIFFNYFCITRILSNKNNFLYKILFILTFFYFNLSFNRIADYGTDKQGQLLIVLIVLEILSIINLENNDKKHSINKFLLIIPIFTYTFTLKAYFLSYVLIIFPILIIYRSHLKFLIKEIIFSGVTYFSLSLLMLMLFHYFASTGCLIFPIKFLCFGNNLFWARDVNDVQALNLWLEQWAKAGAGPNFRIDNPSEYVLYFNWVPNWINKYFFTQVTDNIGIIFATFLVSFFTFLKLKRNQKISINYHINLFYIFLIVIFFLWFFKHPTLRYGGYSAMFLLFVIPAAIFFNKFSPKKNFLINFKIITLIVILIFNTKNAFRINSEFKRNDLYSFTDFPFYKIKKVDYISNVTSSGLVLYKPVSKNGDWDYCWEIPSLCSGDWSKLEVVKLYGYYFVKNTL